MSSVGYPRYCLYSSVGPGAAYGNCPLAGPAAVTVPGLPTPPAVYPRHPPRVANFTAPAMPSTPPRNTPELSDAELSQDNAHAGPGQPPNFTHAHKHNQPPLLHNAGYNVVDRREPMSSTSPQNTPALPDAELSQDNAHADPRQPPNFTHAHNYHRPPLLRNGSMLAGRPYYARPWGPRRAHMPVYWHYRPGPPVPRPIFHNAGYYVIGERKPMSSTPPQNTPEVPDVELSQDNAHAGPGQPPNFTHAHYHHRPPLLRNGSVLAGRPYYARPWGPRRAHMPVYWHYRPGHPVPRPMFQNAGYNVIGGRESMSLTPPQNAKLSQDNAHAGPGQPPNFTHAHNYYRPPLLRNGSMLAGRPYYARPWGPRRAYMPVYWHYRPGPPVPRPMFHNTGYNVIGGRELPPETRPAFRVEPDCVPVNPKQKRIETWTPDNEQALEEELEALVRRIEAEFKRTLNIL